MISKKEAMLKIYDDVYVNHISRQLELEHLENWAIKNARKIKNKEERKGTLAHLETRKEELKYEIDSRKSLLATVKAKLK